MSDPRPWHAVFAEELRDRAKLLRHYADERGAQISENLADEIERRAAAYDDEELDIEVAAKLSGYHAETLRKMRRDGRWSGRRGDLPSHVRTGDRAEQASTEVAAVETPKAKALPKGGTASVSISDRIMHRSERSRRGVG